MNAHKPMRLLKLHHVGPDGVPVFNFAFDVTPAHLIAGIVTEMGVLRAPYRESIAEAFRKAGL